MTNWLTTRHKKNRVRRPLPDRLVNSDSSQLPEKVIKNFYELQPLNIVHTTQRKKEQLFRLWWSWCPSRRHCWFCIWCSGDGDDDDICVLPMDTNKILTATAYFFLLWSPLTSSFNFRNFIDFQFGDGWRGRKLCDLLAHHLLLIENIIVMVGERELVIYGIVVLI